MRTYLKKIKFNYEKFITIKSGNLENITTQKNINLYKMAEK